MTSHDDIKRNGSGYVDPTAYEAIKRADSENEHSGSTESDRLRFRRLLDVIFAICELSGFHLEGRIVVRDKKTGKVWR